MILHSVYTLCTLLHRPSERRILMASMRELADHIIAVANESGNNITNLQLQKIMFFVFGRMVRTYGPNSRLVRDTYNEQFEKWSYGPVVESIYFDYNEFGGRPIEDDYAEQSPEYEEFNGRILNLLRVNPFKLVEMTHRLPSWAEYEEDIQRRAYVPPYEIADFEREFR